VDVLAVLIIIAVLAAVVAVVSGPLRAGRVVEERDAARLADLRAAREAKYREIRDAEIDYRTGKLSETDYRTLDRELRAEAIAILRELDALEEGSPGGERSF
jgi:type II secretory pathway pseudopilin PulG